MDKELLDKLIKFEGLDFCCPGRQRIDCPKHMWDVPAIYRKRREDFFKARATLEKPLTSSLGYGIEK